jgi:predicted peroxiredoxin
MKALLTAVMLAALSFGPAVAQDKQKLVTVVTTDDPQTQLMAMVLTMQAAPLASDVHILLCGGGGYMALRDAPDHVTAPQPPRGMSSQGLMRMIQERTGATIEVCAIYLPGTNQEASDLLDGVGVAQPPEMAARLMDPNTRVFQY